MKVYKLKNNIHGEGFQELLKNCFEACDCFSLTNSENRRTEDGTYKYMYENEKKYMDFLKSLSPNLVHVDEDIQRHFMLYCGSSNVITVYYYKTSPEACEFLQHQFENMYFIEKMDFETFHGGEKFLNSLPVDIRMMLENERKEEYERVTDLPQDICFYRNKKLFLGTISHESYCYLFSEDDAVLKKIFALGEWEQMDDGYSEHLLKLADEVSLKF